MSAASTSFTPSLYYKSPLRVRPIPALAQLFLLVFFGVIFGVVYGVLVFVVALVKIRFIATIMTGFLFGGLSLNRLTDSKIQNPAVAVLITFLGALALLAASWEAFLYMLINQHHKVDPIVLLTHPLAAGRMILAINNVGVWKFNNQTLAGPGLWTIWFIEAAILVLPPLCMVRKGIAELLLCRHCDEWCTARTLINIKPIDLPTLRTELERKNFNILASSGKSRDAERHYFQIYLYGCTTCDNIQTLCVDDCLIHVDRGRVKLKSKPVIHRLCLSHEETIQVATVVAEIEQIANPAASNTPVAIDAQTPKEPEDTPPAPLPRFTAQAPRLAASKSRFPKLPFFR